MFLFLVDQQFKCREVGGVALECGLGEEAFSVPALTELEALEGANECPSSRSVQARRVGSIR